MNTVALFGFGGGGAALNFKVVGGLEQPATPSENTIWISTDANISSYIFSAEQPAETTEGMVWIQTGKQSSVAFSATKKNPVMVYPLAAKQYVSGAWVDLIAKIYQDGEWHNWFSGEFLFDEGNLCEEITGGWEKAANLNINVATSNGVYEIGSTLYVSTKDSSGNANRHCALATVNPVDVTEYSTMVVVVADASGLNSGSVYNCFGLSENKAAHTAKAAVTGIGELTLDISALTGKYYPFIHVSNDDRYVRVSKVWLE